MTLLGVQGCGSSSSTGPQPALAISNLTVRPLGAVLADRPVRVEFTVAVSDPRAVVGGEARVRRALADEVACRAPGKSPIIATAPIGDANVSGTTVGVVITLRLPAGRNRLCYSLVTGVGAAEAKKSGQTELTLFEVASNELEFTIDVGGGGAPASGPDASAPPVVAAPPLPRVSITATDPSAGEPADLATILVTRTVSLAGPLTVFFSVAGTATPGADYIALPASVTIPSGVASVSLPVTPIDDGDFENPETIVVTLTPKPAYVVATPSAASITLTSNDGTVTVAASDAAAAEPSNAGQFRFTRTGTSTIGPLPALTVLYTVSGTATPGSDYVALPGSVTIPAGAASANVAVTVIDDGELEPPETIIVTLAPNAAYAVGSPSTATVNLTSNDGTVTVVANDATAAEPSSTGQFRFSRAGTPLAAQPALTVSYTVSGTATNGVDYVTLPGSITIPAGVASVNVAVTPIDDGELEPPETIIVTLAAGAGYVVGSPSTATVTLTSNDGTVTVVANDATAAEPSSTGQFRFTRTGSPLATLPAVTVSYTVSGTATPGTDYTALSGSVTIPAGAASQVVTVTPIDDGELEPPETIIVTLAAGAGYVVGSPSTATVTLTSNDGTVTVVANDATAAEPASTGQFRFTRAGTPTASLPAVTVSYSVSGTATPGADYAALSGSVIIPAGVASALVTVTPIDDPDMESSETIIVTVTSGTGYVVGSPSTATVTLTSNDGTVTVVANDAAAAELPINQGQFRFTRTGTPLAAQPALTVLYTVSGTATPGADYAALSGSVIIPAGVASATVTVTVIDDLLPEPPETVIVTITSDPAYFVGGASTATVTITSNE